MQNNTKTKTKLIPKLRFKEFEDEWIQIKLIDIVSVMTDYVASGSFESLRNNVNVFEELNYALYVRLTDLRKSLKHKKLKYVDKSSYEFLSKSNLYGGELLIANIGANVGDVYMMPFGYGKATIAPNMIVIRENKTKFISSFLFYSFNSFGGKKSINKAISGSGQPKLSKTDFKKIKLNITNLKEQQKIAAFLTAVDTKLEQLGQKKELLANYKKDVMQQLFSQQLRFKNDDGTDFPDWSAKRLGEIATKKSSNISANTIEENFGNYKLYGASGYIKSIDFYREEEDYISIVKDGAGVGRTLLCEANSSVLGTLDIIQPKIKVNLYFLYSVLNNIEFKKYTIGSTIPHIYFKDYSKEKIKIPSLKEQQKIANYLSAIDKKITTIQTQIDKTRAFKKGLLQGMFV